MDLELELISMVPLMLTLTVSSAIVGVVIGILHYSRMIGGVLGTRLCSISGIMLGSFTAIFLYSEWNLELATFQQILMGCGFIAGASTLYYVCIWCAEWVTMRAFEIVHGFVRIFRRWTKNPPP